MTGHKHGTGGSNSLLSSAKSKENYNTLGGFINESFLNENTKDNQDSKLIFEKPRTRTSIISIKGPPPPPKPSLPTSVLSIWFLIISPTFWKFVWKAFSKGLNVDDLWHVGEPNNAGVICERFEVLWNDEVKKKGLDKASFIVVAAKYILPQLIIALLGVVIMGACNFVVGVVFLPLLIENMSSTNKEFAVLMVLAILLVDFLRSTLFLYVLNTGAMIGKRVQGAIMNLALKKTLRSRKMGDAISAKIVNLCATDVYLLYNATRFLCFIFLVIVQSVLTIVYTIVVLDVWALVGCALIILYTPLQVCFGQMSAKFTKQAMSFMDKRVSMVSSVLNSIKIIKMYAWENIFKNTILDLRTQELRKFFIKTFFDALNLVITPVIPIIAYSVSIICYALFKEMPKPSLVFSIVVVFNNLNGMVYFLSYAQRYIFDSLIAVKRIKQFFLIEEVEPMEMLSYGTSAVEFKNATLGFDIQDLNIKKRKKKNRRKGKLDTQLNIIGKYVATINDLTMNVKKGSLIGICGSIGSGKSSLLSGILGEAKILQGTIKVTGSIAYVPQEAWIIAGTLRENILLGSDYDEKRYQEAILVSCLKPDIDMLDNGDLTEIRERGINLSGGQRQRVSMARAIYNTSDVYLLDDPLSALDSKVGRYIFNYAIQGYLKSKTVLLVTHQLQYLKECEQILFLKNGRIFESGSHSDLMALNGEYAGLIIKHIGHEDEERSKDLSPSSLENSLEDLLSSILEEETAHKASVEPEVNGVITFSRIFDYFRAGGICLFLTFILSLTLHQGCATFANSWLGEWLKKYPNGTKSTIPVDDSYDDTNSSLFMMDTDYNDNNSYYNTEAGPISNITTFLSESLNVSNITNLLPYAISEGNISNLIPDLTSFKNISKVLTKSFFNNISDLLTEADSSTNISDALTEEVPYNIFDHLPKDTDFYFTILGAGLGGVLVFGFTTMYIFATLTTSASRNLHKRLLDKVIRSPMSFFDSTETGQILSRFTRDMLEVDLSISFCSTVTCTRIFSVLGTLCQAGVTQPFTVIIFGGFIVVVFFLNKVCFGAVVQTKQLENTVRAQIIGHMTTISQGLSSIRAFKREKLFIDKCHTLTNNDCVSGLLLYLTLNWGSWVLQSSFLIIFVIVGLVFVLTGADETESGVVLSAMLQNILMLDVIIFCLMEIEARLTNVQRIKYYIKTLTTEGDEYLPTEGLAETELFPNGRVIFDDVHMRYKPKSPLVLNGITFEVYPGEKVGIVGRTGAGKSSIGSVLFRLVELCGGKIIIDGIDIKDLALYDLRSKLSIIPQEPVLFPGTLRYNLDPLDDYDDFTLWQALERSHLKSRIQAEEKQLDTFVDSQGDNFSVGERQLICLARALLRNSKVLFLDEATASVDTETDSLIQETIKSEFKTCTVLSIAHRLNTVMNCDRILVLNFGEVVEFDSPANLLSDPDSSFRSMALEAGLLTSSLTKL